MWQKPNPTLDCFLFLLCDSATPSIGATLSECVGKIFILNNVVKTEAPGTFSSWNLYGEFKGSFPESVALSERCPFSSASRADICHLRKGLTSQPYNLLG